MVPLWLATADGGMSTLPGRCGRFWGCLEERDEDLRWVDRFRDDELGSTAAAAAKARLVDDDGGGRSLLELRRAG